MKKNTILIDDIIGGDWYYGYGITAKSIRSQISKGDADDSVDEHEVIINSPGGSFMDGLAIYNIIAAAKKPVKVHIEGIAASMAGAIAFANGKPTMAANALLMLHTGSTGVWGNAQDFREAADALDKFDSTLAVSISQSTDLSEEEVTQKWLNHKDNWITAKEAEAAGLVTVVKKSDKDTSDIKDLSIEQVFARFAAKHSATQKETFLDGIANRIKSLLPGAKIEKPAQEPNPDTINPDDTMKILVANHAALIAAAGITVVDNATEVEVTLDASMIEAINKKLGEGAKAATDLAEVTNKLAEKANELEKVTNELTAIKANPAANPTTPKAENEPGPVDMVYDKAALKKMVTGK